MARTGKFVVKKGTTGKFRFSLNATNGEIVATSEAYNTKAAAMKGIDSIRRLAADATVDDRTAPAAKKVAPKKAAPTKAAPKKIAAKKAAPKKTAKKTAAKR